MELRREVDSLLAGEHDGPEWLNQPLGEAIAPPIELGTQVGHYQVMEVIGRGGMGEVYRAVDTRLQRDVALKFLPAGSAMDPEALRRFQREARAASALNHPNICTIYDVGEYEGKPFLVMELLEGQSLKERLAGGPLPPDQVLAVALQLTDALRAAHAERHRASGHQAGQRLPVRPRASENPRLRTGQVVTRARRKRPAATRQPATRRRAMKRLPDRGQRWARWPICPRNRRGEEQVDVRTDLFSLGVVLYQMATGRLPFQAASPASALSAVLENEPIPPRRLNPRIQLRLERIILKALQKERAARYQNATKLGASLERLAPAFKRPSWTRVALTVLAALVLAVASNVRWTSRAVPALRPRPLTTFPGVEQFPIFSPDDRYVAFSWNGEKGGHFDLYRMPVTGGTPERLTDDDDNECHPAWAPDGGSIAFFQCSPGTTGSGMRETKVRVWVLDLATGRKRDGRGSRLPQESGHRRSRLDRRQPAAHCRGQGIECRAIRPLPTGCRRR